MLEDSIISSIFFFNFYFPAPDTLPPMPNSSLPFTPGACPWRNNFISLSPLVLACLKIGNRTLTLFIGSVFDQPHRAQAGTTFFSEWNFYLLPTRAWELLLMRCVGYLRKDRGPGAAEKRSGRPDRAWAHNRLDFLLTAIYLTQVSFLSCPLRAPPSILFAQNTLVQIVSLDEVLRALG